MYGKNKKSTCTKGSVRMSRHKLFGGFIDTICSFGMNPFGLIFLNIGKFGGMSCACIISKTKSNNIVIINTDINVNTLNNINDYLIYFIYYLI